MAVFCRLQAEVDTILLTVYIFCLINSEATTMCGEKRILLNKKRPEKIIRFPDVDEQTRILFDNALQRVPPIVSQNATEDSSNDTDTDMFKCYWIIATDSRHFLAAFIDFESDGGYIMTARDERGFSKNCTKKHCEIESYSSLLTLEFQTRQIDSIPATRFSAKLVATSLRKESRFIGNVWWIVLLVLFSIFILVSVISYLFYMKRKHLLSRIFRLLRSSDGGSKSEQTRKKIVTLANGQQVCISNCRRQHRTSVTSYLSHFEPMPTIHEEEDFEFDHCSTHSEPIPVRSQPSTPPPKQAPVCKKPMTSKVLPYDKAYTSRNSPATSCGYAAVVDMFMLERTAVC